MTTMWCYLPKEDGAAYTICLLREYVMLRKGLFLAAAAALTALPAMSAANAVPVTAGFALQTGDAAIVNVQYADPCCGLPNPLEIPARIIAGTVGLVAGVATGGAVWGPPYYSWGGTWDDRVAACFANYQSFDPVSGTYTTYEGWQVVCPFLVQ